MDGTPVKARHPIAPEISRLVADHRPGGPLERDFYVAPEVFTADLARIFHRHWIFVGYAFQVPRPGDFFTYKVGSESIIVLRDRSGGIRAFHNVCRHRGARLVADEGTLCQRQSLSCPYHAWTYRLDGSLGGVPMPEAFPALQRSLLGLRELPSAVRHGLIWAVLDPDADKAALEVLSRVGVTVVSEESGITGPTNSAITVVIDPIDGSSNAARDIPYWATSLCALDRDGPLVLRPGASAAQRGLGHLLGGRMQDECLAAAQPGLDQRLAE